MPVVLAAQLRWKELTCAPSFTWYGLLGGADWRKGVRHGIFAVAACAATVRAPLEGSAPRSLSEYPVFGGADAPDRQSEAVWIVKASQIEVLRQAPRQCGAEATEKAPETGSTLVHTRRTQVHASPRWSTHDPRRSTLVHPEVSSPWTTDPTLCHEIPAARSEPDG